MSYPARAEGLVNSTCFSDRRICTQFNPSTVKVIPWYLRMDAPVIYTGAFLIWRVGRVGGQYVTIRHALEGKVIRWELCQKSKFDHTNKWYMYSQESIQKKWDIQISLGFWDTNRSPNLSQTTRPSESLKKKESLLNNGFSHSDWPLDKTKRKRKER